LTNFALRIVTAVIRGNSAECFCS